MLRQRILMDSLVKMGWGGWGWGSDDLRKQLMLRWKILW